MQLIVDSGATKTDWIIISEGKQVKSVQTTGINPYFITENEIIRLLQKELTSLMGLSKITSINFYGAGCLDLEKRSIVYSALEQIFRNITISVNSDLLGAARALYGNREGVACIIGTGSSSCYYKKDEIVSVASSLGYILGDEGSGAHLGKTFIAAYLKNSVSSDIRDRFEKRYDFQLTDILDLIYNKPFPNRFLASFSEFLHENMSDKFVCEMIRMCFKEFFLNLVNTYSDMAQVPVGCVGSVAYYFRDIIEDIAFDNNIEISKIIKSPVEGLIKYHS